MTRPRVLVAVAVLVFTAFGCAEQPVQPPPEPPISANPTVPDLTETLRAAAESPSSREAPQERVAAPTLVPCTGEVLEFDPERPYCDHDEVPAGGMHGMWVFPVAVVKLRSPAAHAGRTLTIRFRSGSFEAVRSSSGFGTGSVCAFELPQDFLDGEYGSINDESVQNFRLASDQGKVKGDP